MRFFVEFGCIIFFDYFHCVIFCLSNPFDPVFLLVFVSNLFFLFVCDIRNLHVFGTGYFPYGP